MARYAGRRGAVYLAITATGAATSVVSLTSWSLDMSQDKIDVTSFLDTNKITVAGLRDISGSFEGNWDDSETKLFAGAVSSTGCNMILYPSLDAPTKYASGVAWIDASLNTGVNDAVKVTVSFSAANSWFVGL